MLGILRHFRAFPTPEQNLGLGVLSTPAPPPLTQAVDAANRLIEARKTNTNVEAAQKEFDDARFTPHAMIVSVVGIVGLAIILWLMRFKPF